MRRHFCDEPYTTWRSSLLVIFSPGYGSRLAFALQIQADVPVRGDFVADAAVGVEAVDIRQKPARLAGNVGSKIPGLSFDVEGTLRTLCHLPGPFRLSVIVRLDAGDAVRLRITQKVTDPFDMLLSGENHVGEHGGTTGSGDDE